MKMYKPNKISVAISFVVAICCWATSSSTTSSTTSSISSSSSILSTSTFIPNPNCIFVIAFPIQSTLTSTTTSLRTATTIRTGAGAFNTHNRPNKQHKHSGHLGSENGSPNAFVIKDYNYGAFVNSSPNNNRSRLQVAMSSSPSSSNTANTRNVSSSYTPNGHGHGHANGNANGNTNGNANGDANGHNAPLIQNQQQQQQQEFVPATNEVIMTPAEHALQNNIPNGMTNNNYVSNNNNNNSNSNTVAESPLLQQQLQDPFTYNIPPSAAQTLDGRLLCAAQCAYSIKHPYFKSSAYRPATTAKRITKGVNSVLIGHTYDGITIAFRGTQSSSPLDWLQNAALFLSNVDPFVGKVHTGFYRASKSLWKPLRNVLREMLEESRVNGWKQDVYLTGHSKGGALATVAAVLMKRDKELPDPTYVCAFAAAKVGDSEFCMEYNKNINQTSYEAHLDLIPFLPPSANTMDMMSEEMTEMMDSMLWTDTSLNKKEKYKWDYQTVGKRKFITKNYDIIDEVTKELDESRIKDIEKYSFLSLNDFKSAHCSSCAAEGCNGYYFHAIAGEVCGEDECTIDEIEEGSDEEQKQQEEE